jgi:4-alpha-glucanotransferase
MRTILASHANLVIFPVQDILGFGADTRLNTPGVATGNWRFRVTKEHLNRIDINKFLQNNKTYARF